MPACLPTRDVVAEDPGCDDVAARRECPLEVGLRHVLGQPAHVQVRPLDGLAARPSVRNLQRRQQAIRKCRQFGPPMVRGILSLKMFSWLDHSELELKMVPDVGPDVFPTLMVLF